MGDEISIVSLDERDRWEAECARIGLPTQSWCYAWGLSASGFTPRLATVKCGGACMLMPFFEREWLGTVDIATLPGLSGASLSRGSAAPLALWEEYAAERGWVAGYVQLAVSSEVPEIPPGDELVVSNEVFLLDLRAPDPLRSASDMVLRKIRRTESSGARLVVDRVALAERLKELYPIAMKRAGALSHYKHSSLTLERWALEPTSLILGAALGDSIEAVSLFHTAGSSAEYQLNASTKSGRDLAAWLISIAVQALRERGVAVLNLGGGVQPGDGLHYFKERFHGNPRPLRAIRQVYDPQTYAELCRRASATSAIDRFPPYRSSE